MVTEKDYGRCDECKSIRLVVDYGHEEIICSNCGLIKNVTVEKNVLLRRILELENTRRELLAFKQTALEILRDARELVNKDEKEVD